MRRAFLSILHLFTVLSFLSAGVAFLAIRMLPDTRLKVADFFLVNYEKCSLIALGFFLTASLLFLSFYLLERGRFLVIRMGVTIDLELVKKTLEECFAKEFQEKVALTDLFIGDGARLEIGVVLAEKETILPAIEQRLSQLFARRFGYRKPFDLVIKR